MEQAEELALRLDQDPGDIESLNLLFGIIHTIKGASSFFEPKTLHQFTHRFEDILKRIQRGEIKVTQRSLSSLLRGIDQIKALLQEFKSESFSDHDVDEMVSALSDPSDDEIGGGFEQDTLNGSGKPTGVDGQLAKRADKENEIKVSVSLLDEFMQMSGEMTVIRNMLNKCVRSIERQYAGDKDVAMLVELLDELHKVNGSVQSKLTELRKIPVKNILRRLPRAVRDISNALGKQADLVINGDELRVDTAIAEVLSNSLLHLVKNSLDHGLEAPEQRLSNGKGAAGTIEVSSCVRNNQVEVEIKDDGRGIDPDVIAEKLIKNGTHTREDIKRMSKRELFEMIFAPGFSTAKQVTDISGRGVGMSMVKSSVEAIGGSIQIDSVLKKETRLTLCLPVPKSVHITNCLFVTCGSEQFGIPEEEIVRVVQVEAEQKGELLRELEGGQAVLLDGQLVSVIKLCEVLGIPSTLAECKEDSVDAAVCLIIVKTDENSKKVALQVDRILDVEDTVIKSVPIQINPFGVYQGATFMNDGTIGMILSAAGIVGKAGVCGREEPFESKISNSRITQEKSALIVFELHEKGLYAIEQSAIFRIEQLDSSRIAYSGSMRIIPYRENALPLVEVDLFGNGGKDESQPTSLLTVLVLNVDGRLVGLVVKEVLDIAETEELSEDLADPSVGIKGHALWDGKTVTVIDHLSLLKLPAFGVPNQTRTELAA